MPQRITATSITYSRLLNLDFYQMVWETLTTWDQSGKTFSDRDDYPAFFSKTRQSLAEFKKGLDSDNSRKIDKELKEADALRDSDLRTFRQQVRSFSGSRRANEIEHYNTLSTLLNGYKDIERKQFSKETAALNQLLDRLQTGAAAKAVEELGLARFVTNLVDSQKDFEKRYNANAQIVTDKTIYNMKALREQLMYDYLNLVDYTEVMLTIRTDNVFQDVFKVIDTCRKPYALSQSHTKKGNKKSDKTPEIDED